MRSAAASTGATAVPSEALAETATAGEAETAAAGEAETAAACEDNALAAVESTSSARARAMAERGLGFLGEPAPIDRV